MQHYDEILAGSEVLSQFVGYENLEHKVQVERDNKGDKFMKANAIVSNNGSSDKGARKIKVFMYHRIVNDETLSRRCWTCLHAREFRKQLELIDRWGFTTITFNDYRLYLNGELNLPRKPVILTFDDGYLDTYQLAFPVLQEFGMKAVVFVVADRRIKENVWDRCLGLPTAQLLDHKHIIKMANEGFEIGSHSLSHARLTELDEDHIWREISHSKLIIEDLLGSPLQSFSYPYGLVNQNVKNIVKSAGYFIACSVFTGPVVFGKDLLETRRIAVRSTAHGVRFMLQAFTPYHYLEYVQWKTLNLLNNGHGNSNGHKLLVSGPKKRLGALRAEK